VKRPSTARVVALALAATAVVAGAGLAGPPAGARAPALATGTSDPSDTVDGSRSHWRLAGRRLTVALPGALVDGAGHRVVTALAQCGESTAKAQRFDEIYPWATVTRRSVPVAASTRTVRILLPRDLAARVNLCTLSVAATPGRGSVGTRAAMTVRRGAARGCRPGPRERVVHRSDTVRVTTAHAETSDGSYVDGYRACVLPRGDLRRIARGEGGGGAGGSDTTATKFTSGGDWLAWVSTQPPHSDLGGVQTATLREIELPSGRPRSIDSAPGTVSELAVGTTGIAAWVRAPSTPAGGAATLQARAPGAAATVVLDRVTPIVCIRAPCPAAGPITGVTVSKRTVSWRKAGVARSATLP
jgi:hypothetical protein